VVRSTAIVGLAGLLLGFILSRIGFSAWDELHRMFVFDDLRMLYSFAWCVVLLAPAWWGVRRAGLSTWVQRQIHRGTLVGGLLFGAGWAIAGACPGTAMVQIGEGQLGAGWTLLGIFLGNWLYSVIHGRYFRWSTGSCLDA
jgi:uncharacterized membrane protein YedE/YeeE